MTPKTLFGLIICNLLWSFHPVMSKQILTEFSPPEAALLRYGSALLAFLLAWGVLRVKNPFALPRRNPDRLWLLVLGLCTFTVAPFLQMTGLNDSRATDSSIITAMEPLMAVLLARLFLREKVGWVSGLAFLLALLGFAFLSNVNLRTLMGGWAPGFIGNVLLLGSAVAEGVYSVLGRKLVSRDSPVSLFGTGLFIGVVALTMVVTWIEPQGLSGFSWQRISGTSSFTWGAVFWIGPIGTCAAYLYWMIALTRATVATLAVTLFVQPLCGAFWGYWFMGDRLTSLQAVGSALILLAVLIPVLITGLMKKSRRSQIISCC